MCFTASFLDRDGFSIIRFVEEKFINTTHRQSILFVIRTPKAFFAVVQTIDYSLGNNLSRLRSAPILLVSFNSISTLFRLKKVTVLIKQGLYILRGNNRTFWKLQLKAEMRSFEKLVERLMM